MAPPYDPIVPAGQKPFNSGYVTETEGVEQGKPSLLDAFFARLRWFLPRNVFYTVPKSFDYWVANTFTLAAGSTWLDERQYLKGRRAWMIINHQYFDYTLGVAPAAVDFVYCNSMPLVAAVTGLWIYPNGGVLSNPVGWGGDQSHVHVLPGTALSLITFVQYA